ncbi:hypothetical protein NW762_012163 [Fusarium torreyae]|uniref:P-loop containing nucleoside triphosphate hydrolase protein n=1 Tax=Fusarium torreyae TaxID=1237075 RepID=A0A9W8RR59_9HYPO|nr:hypothetical protein NW762_012163 [Fusarium torreyae]
MDSTLTEEPKPAGTTDTRRSIFPEGGEVRPIKPLERPPILCLGCPRTGTASLMRALEIIGYPNTHHGWDLCEMDHLQWQWPILDQANDGTFPNLPTYRGTLFSREEWDQVFGQYDAVSDVASFYAESLIPAYPDAKVILVERDIDAWLESMQPVVKPTISPWFRWFVTKVGDYAGYPCGSVSFRTQQGWTRSDCPEDVQNNLRAAYIRHYEYVRSSVQTEMLLNFKLDDGWGPLCSFLGKDVPDIPFPHINEKKEYTARSKRLGDKITKSAARKFFLPWLS